jgi:hypothetical protein
MRAFTSPSLAAKSLRKRSLDKISSTVVQQPWLHWLGAPAIADGRDWSRSLIGAPRFNSPLGWRASSFVYG